MRFCRDFIIISRSAYVYFTSIWKERKKVWDLFANQANQVEKTSKREKKHPKIKKNNTREINIFSQIMHRVIFGEAINRSIERSIEAIGWSSVGRGGDGEEEEEEGASASASNWRATLRIRPVVVTLSLSPSVCLRVSFSLFLVLLADCHSTRGVGTGQGQQRVPRQKEGNNNRKTTTKICKRKGQRANSWNVEPPTDPEAASLCLSLLSLSLLPSLSMLSRTFECGIMQCRLQSELCNDVMSGQ